MDKSNEEIFADEMWQWIHKRLLVLINGIPKTLPEERKPPFVLSKDFAALYEAVARKIVIPNMSDRMRAVYHRMDDQEPEERANFLRAFLDTDNGRTHLWESWKSSWDDTMAQKAIPPKPKPKPKGLKAMFKSDDTPKFGPGAMSEEQWRKKATQIKAKNKASAQNFAHLLKPSNDYIAPTADDNILLRNFFGINANALNKQITAIRQIVNQGNNVGRTFDTYQNAKDVDLALLANCYKLTDPLIEGDKILKHLMLAHSKSDYPLTGRFLSEFFKDRGAE
ncbi:hypothetical protein V5T82_06205 [Magnetovibrio sp. PR-2]|uniref:hypothetical protein n=1 Tax=Magnetovibrio sp. PR-2 TaxID=3120356 RepID=UPI002FCE615C